MSSLAAGHKLGAFDVISLIGKGGMGEVYRARDPRLGRDVAVKILPAAFARDPERLARFEREARLLASLDHSNIAPIFGLEENQGIRAIVMAFIDGPTLADRIAQGAIPVEEAVPIALQIAEAFEYAHERGVIHRDLKPANVKIAPDGKVKVLDFGLAKALDDEPHSAGFGENSPTLTMGATKDGVILGTAGYISPEQVRGKRAGRLSDIWAFGVVLYEMLTGRRLFSGDSVGEILAGVLKEEPKFESVPAPFRALVSRCLIKDPRRRVQSFGEARLMLESPEQPAAPATQAPGAGRRPNAAGWAAAGLMFAGLASISFLHFREAPPAAELVRFQIPLPEQTSFTITGEFAVSPDGRKLVFPASATGATQGLWVQSFDSLAPRPLQDAQIGLGVTLFWSPDSRFVAYPYDGKLRKIDVNGGPPQTICDLVGANPGGGAWGPDGTIILATARGLMKVPASGGALAPVTRLEPARQEIAHRWPVFLPDGKHFVYLRVSNEAGSVYPGSLDDGPDQPAPRALIAANSNLAYVPTPGSRTGRLLFVREGSVLAQAFDPGRLEITGDPVPVADQISVFNFANYARFSASPNGVLVYRTGNGGNMQLTMFDRQGKTTGTYGEPGLFGSVSLSLDGTKAATARNGDIWIVDLTQGTSTRLTSEPGDERTASFSPDGSRVAYIGIRNATPGFYIRAASGAGGDDTVRTGPPAGNIGEWTRDGRFLVYQSTSETGQGAQNLWTLPLDGDRKPIRFSRSPFTQLGAHVSPDGRWIAYVSGESGRLEIYVQGFKPVPDWGASAESGKWLISRGGGVGMIHWRKDGNELTYLAADGNVMAVDISTAGGFRAGTPRPLFRVPENFMRLNPTPGVLVGTGPNNDRFLFALPVTPGNTDQFKVVLNWQAGLKQ